MMREIKFRAWDGERLRLVWGLSWIDGELDAVNTPKYHGPIEDDMAIMQYIGLKDKNGVDICEGDIVTFEYDTRVGGGYLRKRHNATVIYGGKGGDYIDAGFSYKFNDAKGEENRFRFDWMNARRIEVIGNIYENAHLLNETEG